MKRLKQLLDQLTLYYHLECAIAEELDVLDQRIAALESKSVGSAAKIASLDKRYSEILMHIKEINRKTNLK